MMGACWPQEDFTVTRDKREPTLAARCLLAQARRELAQGDLRRASEKGWDAAAQMVKALADQRGWAHDGHRELAKAVNRLTEETGDRQLGRNFYVGYNLHYFGEIMDKEMIHTGLQTIEQLVDKLEEGLR